MNTGIRPNSSGDENKSLNNRETGFYWVRFDNDWFLAKYYDHENLFYFSGYFEGIDPKELHEIDERRLDKKFEGYKRKTLNIVEQAKPVRKEGYYWVMHDAMWFAAYYLSSKEEFYFPGQVIGFDPSELEDIDERRIKRNESLVGKI